MADEGSLVVGVEVDVGDSHLGDSVGDIQRTIVVVLRVAVSFVVGASEKRCLTYLVVGQVAPELDVVDPDLGDLLDTYSVADNRVDLQVPDDHVRHAEDAETDNGESFRTSGLAPA